ncbi:MAG TPA: glycosyltransferase family 1 protein, partial [Candidatus Omnitrophica bacterium]|nr:glycosyltransferase family 1 protein [Candidatus Omnitrophota bacterium]
CLLHHIHGPMCFTETPFPLNYIGFFVETVLMPRIYRKTCFVAVSQDSKKNLISLGIDPDSIEVVYNGVDKETYTPGNQKSSTPTILYLGRIRFYKRIDILIDLLPKIAERVPEVRLLIAGTGIARASLEKEVRNRGLEERIKFLGSVSEKERVKLLQGSWVYVTPSLVEGWGLGVIEANACGTPAVAFKIPGLSEAIESGKFGYLVSNREEMLEKIVKILTNKKLRDELSVGARIRASQFDWDKSARRFLQILERIKNNG